jgi:hypothetical protein
MVYSALNGKNGNATKVQTGVNMTRIPFSPNNPDLEAVQQIIFSRLRAEPNWNQLDHNGTGYAPYVQYAGSEWEGRNALIFAAQEVFWQLIIEGILSPGINSNNLNLPWFHITRYGAEVLKAGPANPHDQTG